jgi:4-hydroxy-tetrahydrodipicolinate synthase
VDAARGADWNTARDLHFRLLPLMRANFIESNPIPVKTALELMGRGKAHFRSPLCALSPEHLPTLRSALEQAGIELATAAGGASKRKGTPAGAGR